MDPAKELEEERKRNAELEAQLTAWHERALESAPPEELVASVYRQQIESLSFHLLKCRRRLSDLESELNAKTKKLQECERRSQELEAKSRQKTEEIFAISESKKTVPESGSQHVSVPNMPSDEELDEILGVGEPEKEKPKSRNTVKDFIKLMKRMDRIKAYDASLLLDVPQETVMKWAKKLADKGYLTMEGSGGKTLVGTQKLKRLK